MVQLLGATWYTLAFFQGKGTTRKRHRCSPCGAIFWTSRSRARCSYSTIMYSSPSIQLRVVDSVCLTCTLTYYILVRNTKYSIDSTGGVKVLQAMVVAHNTQNVKGVQSVGHYYRFELRRPRLVYYMASMTLACVLHGRMAASCTWVMPSEHQQS